MSRRFQRGEVETSQAIWIVPSNCSGFHCILRPFVSGAHRRVSLCFMVIASTIQVANLGMADSLILMVMALVVFGPRRLPQIGRQIGKLMSEFRKASNDF